MYKVHIGYTPKGRDKWRKFPDMDSAVKFCGEVFKRCNIVLTIVKA